ncbi:hypothetical protein HAX54_050402, partial [Datura stramonium]|nr:hypothetical protein [Datura stramonium]
IQPPPPHGDRKSGSSRLILLDLAGTTALETSADDNISEGSPEEKIQCSALVHNSPLYAALQLLNDDYH